MNLLAYEKLYLIVMVWDVKWNQEKENFNVLDSEEYDGLELMQHE